MEEAIAQKKASEESLMETNHAFSKMIHEVDSPIREMASENNSQIIKNAIGRLKSIITILILLVVFQVDSFAKSTPKELIPAVDSINYYDSRHNLPKMRYFLDVIKKESEKINYYDTYSWIICYQLSCSLQTINSRRP